MKFPCFVRGEDKPSHENRKYERKYKKENVHSHYNRDNSKIESKNSTSSEFAGADKYITTVGVCARTSDAAWNTSEGWLDFAKNVRAQKKKPKTKLNYR